VRGVRAHGVDRGAPERELHGYRGAVLGKGPREHCRDLGEVLEAVPAKGCACYGVKMWLCTMSAAQLRGAHDYECAAWSASTMCHTGAATT
jgi:hypothetical protein